MKSMLRRRCPKLTKANGLITSHIVCLQFPRFPHERATNAGGSSEFPAPPRGYVVYAPA